MEIGQAVEEFDNDWDYTTPIGRAPSAQDDDTSSEDTEGNDADFEKVKPSGGRPPGVKPLQPGRSQAKVRLFSPFRLA
jgi:hypothetical protein